MKKVLIAAISAGVLFACQMDKSGPRYFTASPEIDLVKKGNAAYVAGNWQALREMYTDSARVLDNAWDDSLSLTPEKFLSALQSAVSNYTEFTISDDAVYEMIINDDGEKWVHNWFLWKGKHKNGMEIQFPIHTSFRIAGDKVDYQVNMYNTLPAYLADNAEPIAEAGN